MSGQCRVLFSFGDMAMNKTKKPSFTSYIGNIMGKEEKNMFSTA